MKKLCIGCNTKKPSFNYATESEPLYCKGCSKKEMINLIKGQKIFFTLYIQTELIDEKYSLIQTNFMDTEIPVNSTKIVDLAILTKTISFLDPSKKTRSCEISIINYPTIESRLQEPTHCFWCRHSIPNRVIGCPINFIPNQIVKKYKANNNNEYKIYENTNLDCLPTELISNPSFNFIKKGYYEADGAFCSFNCCKAYIDDNKSNPFYFNSDQLLIKMYKDLIGDIDIKSITPAPHWRKLIEYGGDLSISKFRDTFNYIEYRNHGYIKMPQFLSIGVLFEQRELISF